MITLSSSRRTSLRISQTAFARMCEPKSSERSSEALRGSFSFPLFQSSVTSVVRAALEESIESILTTRSSVDILRLVQDARKQGKTFSIVFCGVNGVGKSTSLSKVAYYFKSKGLRVLLAACDTYRSGAVEQLRVHVDRLGLDLFERGYTKDPSDVAYYALRYANEQGFDVCLIDTAGRMQNNEGLMRSLVKLVNVNHPDLILFVGEALVGNDGVDQLREFNRVAVGGVSEV